MIGNRKARCQDGEASTFKIWNRYASSVMSTDLVAELLLKARGMAAQLRQDAGH